MFTDGDILVFVHVHVFECLCLRMVPYWCLSMFMYLSAFFKDGAILMFVHVHVFECLCLRMEPYWCLSQAGVRLVIYTSFSRLTTSLAHVSNNI